MRFDDPQKPKAARGIIIVDTSALLYMSVLLADRFIVRDCPTAEKSLNKALIFLSKHGYEIIIPEMVALEARVARNGASQQDYFSPSKNARESSLRLHAFLRGVPNIQGAIYIAPPPAQDNSDPAIFARSMWSILNSNDPVSAKRSMIKGFDNVYPVNKRKNFGDIAACQLFRFMKGPSLPVFYLSQDQESRAQMASVRRDVPINWLSVGPLYEGMRREGLLNLIGIADVPFQEIFNYIQSVFRQETEDHRFTTLHVLSDKKFNASLSGLKNEMPFVRLNPTRNSSSDERLANLDRKFGAFWGRHPK